ncbi:MAG: EAL domain-containing protein [Niallia nealsonii]|uniref:EAL domain-containing protein n=1 Tax=Niallia alba TaxID=2729105 RepID=UPI0028FDE09E|nr:EAL domain-containing protein [Niallia nealsonii]MED3793643.1 EAL domain-containing protein [Niallia alba]
MAKFNFLKDRKIKVEEQSIKQGNFEYLLKKRTFDAIFEKHPDIVFTLDINGNLMHCNPSLKQILGYEKMDLDKNVSKLYLKQQLRRKHIKKALNGEGQNFRATIIHINGQTLTFDITYVPIMGQKEQILGIYGIAKDVTSFVKNKQELLRVKENLEKAEERFRNIYDNLEVGIWSLDVVNNKFLLTSPGVKFVTGYSADEMVEMEWESIVHPDDLLDYRKLRGKLRHGDSLTHTYRIISKEGEIKQVQDQTIPVLDHAGNVIRLDGIVSDITFLEKSKEEITYLAYHDYLTDLSNKRMFDEKMEELIHNSKKNNKNFACLYLNLDRFKQINDRLGHAIGDKLLQQFTIRLDEKLKMSNYLFARLGGDEFGILLWDFKQSDYPISIAKGIIDCMKKSFLIDEYELFATTSVGISTFPIDGKTKEELVKKADAALHRAKEMGKNNYQIYSTLLNISSFKQFQLERDLYKAMERDEFFLQFQPRVNPLTGKIISAEALIRWENAEWGFVSPREFIPIAEENGLILPIGDWVFQEVCNRISVWKNRELPIVPISINISAQRLLKSDFIPTVIKTLKETNTDPSLIEFEITETTLIQYEEVVTLAVQQLKEIGIRIALDDFGTGYSSLSYLKQYPIDTIKLDRSFVRNISISKKDEMIVKSMIFLAKGLDMKIVAEGVETKEQLALLKQQECDEIQGYLFSKPVGEEDFQAFLQKMILHPQDTQWDSREIANRRKFYRINLLHPLHGNMSLVSIKGNKVQLGKTAILIEDIGVGGMRILSNIDLPVRPDIILQFVTTILGEKIEIGGHIVWKHEINEFYQYGIEFIMKEKERDGLVKLLNNFFLQYRKNPLLSNCSFIKEEKISYLRKLHS